MEQGKKSVERERFKKKSEERIIFKSTKKRDWPFTEDGDFLQCNKKVIVRDGAGAGILIGLLEGTSKNPYLKVSFLSTDY